MLVVAGTSWLVLCVDSVAVPPIKGQLGIKVALVLRTYSTRGTGDLGTNLT